MMSPPSRSRHRVANETAVRPSAACHPTRTVIVPGTSWSPDTRPDPDFDSVTPLSRNELDKQVDRPIGRYDAKVSLHDEGGLMLEGRRGHARVLVLTITERERDAVRAEFGADHLVSSPTRGLACWTPDVTQDSHYGVIVSQTMGRSNMPAEQSVQKLIEDWRPEVLIVVGTAGGIARPKEGGGLDGPSTGDVICVEYVHYAAFAKYDSGRRYLRYFPMQHPDNFLITSDVREVETSTDWHDGLMDRPSGPLIPPRVRIGELVSVEVVAGDSSAPGQQDLLRDFDHAIAVDMESGGVARAMHTASDTVYYRPAWLAIRGVSDLTSDAANLHELLGGNNSERDEWTPYAAAAAARFAHRLVERILARGREPFEDPGADSWTPVLHR